MRVNARLDASRERKLREIQSQTGLTTTEVVKHALDLMHRQRYAESKAHLDALLSSDFVGCGDGPRDLASEYKRYLTEGLGAKHGAR